MKLSRASSKARKRCAELVEACTDFVIFEVGLTVNPHYSYKNAVNYMNHSSPTKVAGGKSDRNTPNLGIFKSPNLLVLLSRIKFYEFFGLNYLLYFS